MQVNSPQFGMAFAYNSGPNANLNGESTVDVLTNRIPLEELKDLVALADEKAEIGGFAATSSESTGNSPRALELIMDWFKEPNNGNPNLKHIEPETRLSNWLKSEVFGERRRAALNRFARALNKETGVTEYGKLLDLVSSGLRDA